MYTMFVSDFIDVYKCISFPRLNLEQFFDIVYKRDELDSNEYITFSGSVASVKDKY